MLYPIDPQNPVSYTHLDVYKRQPYIPKGYAVEWMECRRYYQHRCRAIAIKNNIDYYSITYWHGMGKIPTVKLLEFNYAGSGTVANSFGANDTLNCNEEWCRCV